MAHLIILLGVRLNGLTLDFFTVQGVNLKTGIIGISAFEPWLGEMTGLGRGQAGKSLFGGTGSNF